MSDETLVTRRKPDQAARGRAHDDGARTDAEPAISDSEIASLRSAGRPILDHSGRAFESYQIGELLGAGGSGQVYAARHRWLERPVAIKFLTLPDSDEAGAMERFRREAVTAARMDHPSFVRAIDGGIAQGQAYLVTDLIDGDDLLSVVRTRGRFPIAIACRVIADVARAMAFLERKGVVHRDLKPSNLIVDRRGRVFVLDLGLARSVDASTELTRTGAVMGTVDYLAPEQSIDPRGVTSKADMYSLGCTLYFLLTGRTPYDNAEESTLAQRLLSHVEQEHQPIQQLRSAVPDAVARLLDRMLEKSPEDRPRSFEAIAVELERHCEDVDLATAFGSPDTEDEAAVEYDWIDELIVRLSRGVGRTLLVITGFLESVPSSRPGGRTRYQFSYRWLKAVGWVFGFYALLYFAGIGFEIPQLGVTFGAPPPPGYEFQ